jgi:hypothetical protein
MKKLCHYVNDPGLHARCECYWLDTASGRMWWVVVIRGVAYTETYSMHGNGSEGK